MLTCTLNRHISLQILHHFFAMIQHCILFFGKITTKNIWVYQMTIKPQMTLFLEYICVSRFWVLPAQYQILSSCPSLLYIHRGPMGIFNIRSQNFWVNQNEKCENILSIRSGSCAEKPPISEGELQWKMGWNIRQSGNEILTNNFWYNSTQQQRQVGQRFARDNQSEVESHQRHCVLELNQLDAGLTKLLKLIF